MPMPVAGRLGRASRFLVEYDYRDGLDANGLPIFRSGQIPTFGRGGTINAATAVDRNGRGFTAGPVQPRFHHEYNAATGLWESQGLLLEGGRSNIIKPSADFGTTWTPVGTPTRTAAAHTASGVSLDLIGDDDAAALEGYLGGVVFTGNGVKAISIIVKQGTSPHTGIRVRDNTGGVEKLRGTIEWSGGLPVLNIGAASSGAVLGYRRRADGSFRVKFATEAVTAANSHVLYVYPATTSGYSSAITGDVYAGGVQVENGPAPSSYIPTVGSTVTRDPDALSVPFLRGVGPMTVYGCFEDMGFTSQDGTFIGVLWSLGGTGVGTAASMQAYSEGAAGAAYVRCSYVSTVGNVRRISGAASSLTPANAGRRHETLHTLDGSAHMTGGYALDGGALVAGTESDSGVPFLVAAFNPAILRIGRPGSASQESFASWLFFRVAAGVRSLDYMRAGT